MRGQLLLLLALGGAWLLLDQFDVETDVERRDPVLRAAPAATDSTTDSTPVAAGERAGAGAASLRGRGARAPVPAMGDAAERRDAQLEWLLRDPIQSLILRQQADTAWHQRLDELEQGFYSQPVDATWAFAAANAIDNAFAQPPLADSAIRYVDCRTTLCRIEVSHLDDHARSVLFVQLPALLADSGDARFIVDDRDGADDYSLLYLLREGVEPL